MTHAFIVAALLTVLPVAQAAGQQPETIAPVPGAPGTPTPSPYPQITPSSPPRSADGKPGGPLLPPMPTPGPGKDQPLLQELPGVPPKAPQP